jgi:hypothetical protein
LGGIVRHGLGLLREKYSLPDPDAGASPEDLLLFYSPYFEADSMAESHLPVESPEWCIAFHGFVIFVFS